MRKKQQNCSNLPSKERGKDPLVQSQPQKKSTAASRLLGHWTSNEKALCQEDQEEEKALAERATLAERVSSSLLCSQWQREVGQDLGGQTKQATMDSLHPSPKAH